MIVRMRADLWITTMATAIISLGAYSLTHAAIDRYNNPPQQPVEVVQEAPAPEPGDVGTLATGDIPRASTIEEILSAQQPFTIEVPKRNIEWVAPTEFSYLRLEDGEKVLVVLDRSLIQESGRENDFMCILPVGEVVREEAPEEVIRKTAGSGVTNTGFYVLMKHVPPEPEEVPAAPTPQRKRIDAESWAGNVLMVVMVLSFTLIRVVCVRKGIFPPMLPKKNRDSDDG